jgi:hypothetical protein
MALVAIAADSNPLNPSGASNQEVYPQDNNKKTIWMMKREKRLQ